MPQSHSDAATAAGVGLDAFTAGYIECIYFTETGDGDQPDSEVEMAAETIETIKAECAEWQADNAALLAEAYDREGYDETRAGHDFWYTRNGHGVGFWDRGELGEGGLDKLLTRAARAAGEQWVVEGDDGLLYLS